MEEQDPQQYSITIEYCPLPICLISPKKDSIVKLQYIAYTNEQTPFDYQQILEDPFIFRIGSPGLLQPLQQAICQMTIGQTAHILIKAQYAYNLTNIDKFDKTIIGQDVTYHLTLLQSYESTQLDNYIDRYQLANQTKQLANTALQSLKYKSAKKQYKKAMSYLDFDESITSTHIKVAILNNLSLCAQKQSNYKQMYEKSKEGVSLLINPKGLIRMADALSMMNEYQQAYTIIQQLSSLQHPDYLKEVSDLKNRISQKHHHYSQTEKQKYMNMFK